MVALAVASCGRVHFDPSPISDAPQLDASLPPDAPASVVALIEAESGTLTPPFEVALDPAAFDGAYLLDNDSMGLGGPGEASYTFSVATAGTYYIWGRTLAVDTTTDSFFVALDGGPKSDYEDAACSYGPSWKWAPMLIVANCPNPNGPKPFALTAGAHTLVLSSREGDSKIDRILITSDPMFDAKD